MSTFKEIRERLGVTQVELGAHLGRTQGNISHYETGMTVPPETAKRLIVFAKSRGVHLTLEDVYGKPGAIASDAQAAQA